MAQKLLLDCPSCNKQLGVPINASRLKCPICSTQLVLLKGKGVYALAEKPAPKPIPAPTRSANHRSHDDTQIKIWVIIAIFILISVVAVCYSMAPNTKSADNTVIAPSKSDSPKVYSLADITLLEVSESYHSLSVSQWDKFSKELLGKRVQWVATIDKVNPSNLQLEIDRNENVSIYLDKPVSNLDVDAGDIIEFTATISKIDTDEEFHIWLEEPNITKITYIQTKIAPTASITAIPSETPSPSPTNTPAPFLFASVSVGGNANLRAGPGKQYSIVGDASNGDEIAIYARSHDNHWLQLDWMGTTWIAAGLVELPEDISTIPLAPTPTPTSTKTLTPTPKLTATARKLATANAMATINAYVDKPPESTWCEMNSDRAVCVTDFRYRQCISYTSAPSNGRFVAFGIAVKNIGASDITVSPFDVYLAMKDGRTYDYSTTTYSYWSDSFDTMTIPPGNTASGGLVFLVPNDVGLGMITYEVGWFESDIEINLRVLPTPTDIPPTPKPRTSTPIVSKPANLIIDVKAVIGQPSAVADNVLGPPSLITPNDDNDDVLAGGEYRDYYVGNFWLMVSVDRNGITRGVQVLDGLSAKNYSIHDWREILPRFGLSVNQNPDQQASAALYWNNFNGYGIAVVANSSTGRPVWTVQIEDAAVFRR